MPRRKNPIGSFAQRLVQIRKAGGLSQYDLADLAGVSQRMIAHYETKFRNPASDTVIRLAKALKINISDLMGNKSIRIKEGIDRKVIKKAKLLEGLSPKDKKAVMQMIDTLHLRQNGR